MNDSIYIGWIVPVENVDFEVALLARAYVGTVWTMPPSKCLHHDHVGQTVLETAALDTQRK